VYVAGDVARFEQGLLEQFGGFSRFEAQGAWKDPKDGQVFQEPSVLYHVFSNKTEQESVSTVDVLFRERTSERSVLVETPARAEFLER